MGKKFILLSPNGKYIFCNYSNSLYSENNGKHTLIWNNTSIFGYAYCQFFPNSDQIALYDGNNFMIKNCIDMSTVLSYNLNGETFINVDFNTNNLLTYTNNTFKIYDVSTGSLIKTIPTSSAGFSSTIDLLFNNYLISDLGYEFNINMTKK